MVVIKKGMMFIILMSVFVLVICSCAFTGDEKSETKNVQEQVNDADAEFRTDIEPISKTFPNLGEVLECYWKADFFGGEASFRVPGPNPYWIQGFAKISEDDINKFKEEYDWTLVEEGKKPDLETEILNLDEEDFEWYYSEEFNKYVKPAKYSGVFYIDFKNNIIYFYVCV